MDVRDFDFDLPPELIAQEPPASRGGARLLHLGRESGSIAHAQVSALPDLLRAGDLVVVNNTRVFPARLLGHRVPSGGSVECVLLTPRSVGVRPVSDPGLTPGSDPGGHVWEALVHPGQKLKPGARMKFDALLHAEILEWRAY